MMNKTNVLWMHVFCLAAFWGCGGQSYPEGFPQTVPCVIPVRQDSQPLSGAVVTLHPMNENLERWAITGTSDASGRVTVSTNGYRGAPPGTYKVTIMKRTRLLRPGSEDPDKDPRAMDFSYDFYDHVGPVFADVETTPLRLEVVSGKTHAPLDAGKPVRVKLDSL